MPPACAPGCMTRRPRGDWAACDETVPDFKVLSFDCYGTLIDWESGILTALRLLVHRAASSGAPRRVILGLDPRIDLRTH